MRQYNVNNSQPEHKFWSIQEVISTSLVVDNSCGSTIMWTILSKFPFWPCNCNTTKPMLTTKKRLSISSLDTHLLCVMKKENNNDRLAHPNLFYKMYFFSFSMLHRANYLHPPHSAWLHRSRKMFPWLWPCPLPPSQSYAPSPALYYPTTLIGSHHGRGVSVHETSLKRGLSHELVSWPARKKSHMPLINVVRWYRHITSNLSEEGFFFS